MLCYFDLLLEPDLRLSVRTCQVSELQYFTLHTVYNDHKPLFFLADGWGYRYLESGREGTVYGGVACTGRKWIRTSEHSCSETRFLGTLLQRWTFCKGSHSRCGEGWPQGTARYSPTPCHLSLFRDRVSEHARYPSFSTLLYLAVLAPTPAIHCLKVSEINCNDTHARVNELVTSDMG